MQGDRRKPDAHGLEESPPIFKGEKGQGHETQLTATAFTGSRAGIAI